MTDMTRVGVCYNFFCPGVDSLQLIDPPVVDWHSCWHQQSTMLSVMTTEQNFHHKAKVCKTMTHAVGVSHQCTRTQRHCDFLCESSEVLEQSDIESQQGCQGWKQQLQVTTAGAARSRDMLREISDLFCIKNVTMSIKTECNTIKVNLKCFQCNTNSNQNNLFERTTDANHLLRRLSTKTLSPRRNLVFCWEGTAVKNMTSSFMT